MNRAIGQQAVNAKTGEILGTITDVFKEDGRTVITIDDDYEIAADSYWEVLDLCSLDRQHNPELPPSFIKIDTRYVH